MQSREDLIPIEGFSLEAVPLGRKESIILNVGAIPSGGAVLLPCLLARGSNTGPVLLVIAGVHGDEYEGPLAVPRALERIEPPGMRGAIIGIPVVNPPAFDAGTRCSPIDGLNLARTFPGRPDGTMSERIAHGLLEYVFPAADLLLDLHSGGAKYECPLMCGYYILEGEIGRISKEAALAFGAPLVCGSPLNKGRSISEAVRHKAIPAVYAETTGGGKAAREDVDAYTTGILNLAKFLGILQGRPDIPGPQTCIEAHEVGRDFDRAINCTRSGLIITMAKPGQQVKKGALLAVIYDAMGAVVEEIRSDRTGRVIGIRRVPAIHAGELVAIVV